METKNKVVMLGDASVGKTAFVSQLTTHKVDDMSTPTVGAAYTQYFYLTKDKKKEKVQIWDTAGSELFRSMTPLYARGAFAALIVFDVTRKSTFEPILEWKKTLEEYVPVVVIGNKSDLSDKREVSTEDAIIFCSTHHLDYRETSALTGDGVQEAYESLMHMAFKKKEEKAALAAQQATVDLNKKQSGGCC